MLRVLILGAGGHAQVVCDILLRAYDAGSKFYPIGFLDDESRLTGTVLMGLPILGPLSQLHEFEHDAIVVAIGDNRTRMSIFETLYGKGSYVINAIHPTAILAPDVCLGKGITICAGVVVNTGTSIGDDVILNTACSIDHHNIISSHVHIAPGVHLGGNVWVGDGAFIGIGASVIPGRTVGKWSIVGAGSVAIKDVPSCTTVAGVPCRIIKQHTCK